jgi:hypothetical protein
VHEQPWPIESSIETDDFSFSSRDVSSFGGFLPYTTFFGDPPK